MPNCYANQMRKQLNWIELKSNQRANIC